LPAEDYTFDSWTSITGPDGNGYGQPMYSIQMNPALYALFNGFPSTFATPPRSSNQALAASGWPTSEWALTDNLAPASIGGAQGVYTLVGPNLTNMYNQLSSFAGNNRYASIIVPQQANCTDNWAAVSALSFHTSLPIVPEDESAPAQAGNEFTPSTSQDVVTSMTDVQLDLAGGVTDWIGKISYEPTSQYRWSLMQGGPIQSMSFSVYWKHRATGKRYLATLMPGGSVEVKLLMQKR
jgi:hypothetical protein